MKLVVDANELFAGLIAKGKKLQSWTLDILFSDEVELFAPFRLLAELENNRDALQNGTRRSFMTLRDTHEHETVFSKQANHKSNRSSNHLNS